MNYSKKEVSMTPEKYQAQCRALEGMLNAANQRIEELLKEKRSWNGSSIRNEIKIEAAGPLLF